jgi:hypothetical protein
MKRSLGTLCAITSAGLITATMAMAPAAEAATTPALKYNCSATVFGTTMAQGVWTAKVTSALPTKAKRNAIIKAAKITAKVTTSKTAADTLRSLKVKTVKGTSTAAYTATGAIVSPGKRTAALTVPTTTVPKSGTLTTTATGTGKAEKAGSKAGKITVTVGSFTAKLTTDSGFVLPVSCTLVKGQKPTLATIAVS